MFSFHDLMCCDVLRAASLQAVPAIADANKVQIAEHILPLWNTHVHYVPLCSITFHCSLLVPTCLFCFHHDSFRNDRFWLSQKLSKLSPFLLRIRWIRTSRRSNSEQLLRVAAQRRWEVSQVSGTCNSPATWCIFALPILLALKRLKSLGFLCLLGVFVLYFVNLLMLFCPCEKSSGIV